MKNERDKEYLSAIVSKAVSETIAPLRKEVNEAIIQIRDEITILKKEHDTTTNLTREIKSDIYGKEGGHDGLIKNNEKVIDDFRNFKSRFWVITAIIYFLQATIFTVLQFIDKILTLIHKQ